HIVEKNPANANAWLSIGQIYLNQDKLDKAVDAFKKCIGGKGGSLKPVMEVWARNLLGNTYDLKSQRDLAVSEYRKVIESKIDYNGSLDYAKKYLAEPFSAEEPPSDS
ncbi:hypothetical protein K8T06_01970, partial [bacterium]|nr:hypothetical protein [bacterium]